MLAATQQRNELRVTLWALVVIGISLYRTLRTSRADGRLIDIASMQLELAILLLAVDATGYWQSPFVFSLITPIAAAGFAYGFPRSIAFAVASVVAVAVPDQSSDQIRTIGQWGCEFLLVALVAGYARRISGEAEREQSLTLDRLGRLADANALLFSLHRVAQTLPASLDLDEALDTTLGRMRDLFSFNAAALLLRDESDDAWTVARREGCRLPARIAATELPPPVRRAVAAEAPVQEDNLLQAGGPALVPRMYAGMYVPLLARGSVIGLIAIEHAEAEHFTVRDLELLAGFAEPAALAIDNARWFSRLRTVGAEEERTRIARDLHDRIGQSLAYLAFELDRIVKAGTSGDDTVPAVERLRGDLRDVIREVRDTLYDLRTDVTEDKALTEVLELYANRVAERSGLTIDIRSQASGRLPLLQEREAFRVAQEALANIEKHANASHVTVTWRCDGSNAILEVADDGQGFPIGRAGRLDSYGIIGMRERADSIASTLQVDSTPGQGTRVRLIVGHGR